MGKRQYYEPVLTLLDLSSPLETQTAKTINVVIVPDAELQKNKTLDQTEGLHSLLRAEAPFATVFQYAAFHRRQSRDWRMLVESGNQLVKAIKQATAAEQTRPLLFVAFGFGGFVVKRAIYNISKLDGHDTALQVAHKEVVLLGAPFIREEAHERDKWPKFDTLLVAYGGFSRHFLKTNADLRSHAYNVSADFDTTAINGNILSIFEEQETKYRRGLLRSSKGLLVGRDLALMNLDREQYIASQTDYFRIARFTKTSETYQKIKEALRRCTEAHTSITRTASVDGSSMIEKNIPIGPGASFLAHNWPDSRAPTFPSRQPSLRMHIAIPRERIPEMPCYVPNQIEKNENFVNRPELDIIDKALRSTTGEKHTHVFALCGYGGIGKTQLAAAYVFESRRLGRFDAIFWVQADEEDKLSRSFNNIAQGLGIADVSDGGIDSTTNRDNVLKWLAEPQKAPSVAADDGGGGSGRLSLGPELANWLLVFDSVNDIELLNKYWPPNPDRHGERNSAILVTSRDSLAMTELTRADADRQEPRRLQLPPMSQAECAKLLLKQTGEDETQPSSLAAAMALAAKIGSFPLAVTQLATRIRQTDETIETYLGRQGNKPLFDELRKVKQLNPIEGYRFTLQTVWHLEDFTPQARALLNTMALLDHDAVPEAVLETDVAAFALGCTPGDGAGDTDRLLQDYPTPAAFSDARVLLSRTSLITHRKHTKELSWHQNVHDITRDFMTDSERTAYFALAVHLLHNAWDYATDRFNREKFQRKKCASLLPHVRQLRVYYGKPLPSSSSSSSAAAAAAVVPLSLETARKFAKLLQEAGWYAVQATQYSTAKPMFEVAVQVCRDHGTAAMEDLLADTVFSYARLGEETNMAATTVFGYCLDFHNICRDQHARNPSRATLEDLATSHTSLAQGFLLRDLYDEAREHCQTCIDLESDFQEHQNGEAMSQFAHIYQAWAYLGLGDAARTAALAQTVIDFRQRQFGPNDTDSMKLGLALHCLGNARARQGRVVECLVAYNDALANFEKTLGVNSFRVGQILLKLAEVLGQDVVRDRQVAELHFSRAIAIFQRTPDYEPELARALYKQHCFQATLRASGAPRRPLPAEAVALYQKHRPAHAGLTGALGESDEPGEKEFDSLVRFWSR